MPRKQKANGVHQATLHIEDESSQPVAVRAEADDIFASVKLALSGVSKLPVDAQVVLSNRVKELLHDMGPFRDEPVDCVRWVKAGRVKANDYNPNAVAPPEMKLLETSIINDGYTQPIVTNAEDDEFVVIDGFHRNRVGRESADVSSRIRGYLPIVQIRASQNGRADRIASTIRHNRARGKHQVERMSDIVVELKRRNWSETKIGKELGMDPDEVLRLCQITGLKDVFGDAEFSKAWELDTDWNTKDGEVLSDQSIEVAAKENGRVYHTWEKWECYRAGFYEDKPRDGMSLDDAEEAYREFLSDLPRFEAALNVVTSTWKHSCEHYLTNDRMNRIAWLGQASVAQALGIPACSRGGYHRLTQEQQKAADLMALKYLNRWLAANGRKELGTLEDAASKTQMDLY